MQVCVGDPGMLGIRELGQGREVEMALGLEMAVIVGCGAPPVRAVIMSLASQIQPCLIYTANLPRSLSMPTSLYLSLSLHLSIYI